MVDDPHNPNLEGGLVPDEEAQLNPDVLTDDTPDHFSTPMDDENLENELPEEGVYPGDTEFEEDLEEEEIRRYEDE